MSFDLTHAMRVATELTRSRKLTDATRVIQEALSGTRVGHRTAESAPPNDEGTDNTLLLEGPRKQESGEGLVAGNRTHFFGKLGVRPKWSLGDVVKTLRQAKFREPTLRPFERIKPYRQSTIPEGAQFLTRSFAAPAGNRSYKLYLPAGSATGGLPLLVMLHGCTQDPDDFALGSRMNALAEEFGFLVAYPHQPVTANPSSCWNWFEPRDQVRGRGEPSLVAGLTEEIVARHDVDRRRVFVAGLSAGGAMAVVMGATYPDVYAGIGVHSGLPYGTASDVMSAFAAMRGEIGSRARPRGLSGETPRAIVFHGDADQTVHPANGARIVASFDRSPDDITEVESGMAGGRSFTRTIMRRPNGPHHAEHWLVAGAGHAWSGGSREGSYTDTAGPDASREMVRFFLAG